MRVALVLAGDELLDGQRADRNGPWLARTGSALGVQVTSLCVVGDDPTALSRALRAAAAGADLVLVSGGLGPTHDDRTREALALAAGVPLVHDRGAETAIRERLAGMGREPSAARLAQAEVPAGGVWLRNPVGVAPGIRVEIDGTPTVALPGVPAELHAMFDEHVRPVLEAAETAPAAEHSVWVAGLPEPEVEDRLRILVEQDDLSVGFYPHEGEVETRLRAFGPDAQDVVAEAAATARGALAGFAYEPGAGRIEHVVVERLRALGLHVATAESVTGGLVARMLTRVPGASDVYVGGWVPYADAQKTARLGVPEALIAQAGVVSETVARAMAEGARERSGADIALATTGVAGPGAWERPGADPVPAGRVFVALARSGHETRCRRLELPFPREGVQRRAAVALLELLRSSLDG